ncbi:MAG: GMP reductase [Candidatus Marinimicrobia bacterium]|nr:GMP reductase [Candidatus Neomarinimicrobiota bacterium]
MKIDYTPQLDFKDVLIRPKRTTLTSRSQVNLERELKFPHSTQTWTGIPVISSNMDTTGTFGVYDVLSKYKMITCLHKFYNLKDFKKRWETTPLDPNYFMISTGIDERRFSDLNDMVEFTGCKWLCIDIANGYMEQLVTFCKKCRATWKDMIIVAGNVATREMVEELIINGEVDVVKVGIGPGSACLTRLKTGVGVPQLSAIIDCADAAHGLNANIIGDGGVTCPGDLSKAFCGGADLVMCGGVFAGHLENPGEVIKENGVLYKLFYGMSSDHAQKKHYGQMNNYRSSEGRVIKIKLKGNMEDTVTDYLGGLRSTCTYINSKCIKYMPKCCTFLLVSQQLNTHLVK